MLLRFLPIKFNCSTTSNLFEGRHNVTIPSARVYATHIIHNSRTADPVDHAGASAALITDEARKGVMGSAKNYCVISAMVYPTSLKWQTLHTNLGLGLRRYGLSAFRTHQWCKQSALQLRILASALTPVSNLWNYKSGDP